jgi:hypothetical protein
MKMKHFLILAVVFVALLALTAATTTEPNRGYSIIPTATDTHTLGTSTYKWLSAAITTLNATTVNATTLSGNLTGTAAPTTLAVGSGGTSLALLKAGSLDFDDASSTVDANTVTGALPGDKVVCTINNATTSTLTSIGAVATTNTVTLYTAADPGTTVSVSYLLWR